MKQDAPALTRYRDAVQFAQELPPRPVYKVRDVAKHVHERTVRRRVRRLAEIGLAQYNRGRFTVKWEVVAQPLAVLEEFDPVSVGTDAGKKVWKGIPAVGH